MFFWSLFVDDIDECGSSKSLCRDKDNSHCENHSGGYSCKCDDNYVEDGGMCVGMALCACAFKGVSTIWPLVFDVSRNMEPPAISVKPKSKVLSAAYNASRSVLHFHPDTEPFVNSVTNNGHF